MPSYRVLAAELMTGAIKEEIPLTAFSYGHALNRPGGFSANIGLRHPKATRSNLEPGRTALYVERDGVIVWGGIVWTVAASVEQSTVSVGGEGLWSYFRRRLIRHNKTYAAADQLVIARDLVNYAQGQAGGNIGVVVGSETSGVLRDRTYPAFERKNLGEAVEQLAAVQNGFDFAVESQWVGGAIVNTLKLSYPRRGRNTSIVFELGANIEGLSQTIDATKQANVIDGLGSGEGDQMLIATVADLTLVPPYPLLETATSHKDVSEAATLRAHANAELTSRSSPVETLPTLLAHSGPDTEIGSFITGDTLRVRGEDGFVSVDDLFRIIAFDVKVDENGRETVAIGLEPEGDFS